MIDEFGISHSLFISVFVFLAFAYIAGEILQRKKSSIFSDILITLGSLWFVGIVHFFFVSVAYDLLKVINFTTKWFDSTQMDLIAYHTTWVIVVTTIVFLLLGYLNARTPAIREYTIRLEKKNPLHSQLRLVVASDIHLGPINGTFYVRRIVETINNLQPDIILFPGDILDGELEPVLRRDLGKYLKKLSAKFGIYGVTGNHEFIGGIDRAASYITEHGITLLRDEVQSVAGVSLIGREDISSARFIHQRKPLNELVPMADQDTALILMDHQPKNLAEARETGIDIQFSGHTHNGQIFPLNFIVKKIFEVASGYRKIGSTHFFVSTGLGTWGPPVRTSARPEILVVNLEFAG